MVILGELSSFAGPFKKTRFSPPFNFVDLPQANRAAYVLRQEVLIIHNSPKPTRYT